MNGPRSLQLMWVLCALCGLSVWGCSKPAGKVTAENHVHEDGHDEHGHGEHGHDAHDDGHTAPKDLAEAVARLNALDKNVKAAFEAGEPKKADGDVHAVGHILEALPKLLEASTLSAEDQSAVKKAGDDLFKHYMNVDAKLHGKTGVDYSEVAQGVADALAVLNAKIPASPSGSTPE